MHGTDTDVGDFGSARQAERVGHHFRDVFRLHQEVRLVGAAFLFEQFRDARRRGAVRINAEHADAERIDFVA